jgi:hypothetical protein
MNYYLMSTIPKLLILGEWCKNEGKHSGDRHVFRRACGNAYCLNDEQLLDILKQNIEEN